MAEPGRRIIFDLSSAARWSGPPVGIVRSQRELARWARRNLRDALFAVYDPDLQAYREVVAKYVDPIVEGEASLNTWAAQDPTGGRRRRSAFLPTPIYAALQLRRTSLRLLERVRLGTATLRLRQLADKLQRALITRRYRIFMIGPDGGRRAFPTLDMALGAPVDFSDSDILFCSGFGWSHTNIGAIDKVRAASGFRLAVLCYDIIPLMFPDFFKPRDVDDMRRYWRPAFAIADLVIVNAEAIARDVRSYCASEGIALARLGVAGLGATPVPRGATPGELPGGLVPGRYALFVSTIEPRKGHELLYRIWLDLLAEGVPQANGFKLVFVGRPGWKTETLQEALRSDPRIAGSLIHLDGADDAALAALYAGAAFCVYPSLYEGFGLPLVEAFAHGKAVLASDRGALAEVAAGFSPTLDAEDAPAWRLWLRTWIEDPAARSGYEQAIAERFQLRTWDEACAEIFDLTLTCLEG